MELINSNKVDQENKVSGRLLSLDFFRGITMFLLIAEYTGLYHFMIDPYFEGTFIHSIGLQLNHHTWNGLTFWDLVQPYFMFIVGVAMPFSTSKRLARGDAKSELLKHAIKRALLMLLFGWALYCISPGRITFRFQNVLAQLSLAYILAFVVMNYSLWKQLGFSFLLIALTEIIYRTFAVSGFDQPFTPDKNFGAFFDLLISGELSGGHWVSFNAVPTTAHVIWGVLAGKLLMSNKEPYQKIKILVIAGIIGLIIGYGLDPITPIIKRIGTSSFVIVTGGWCLLTLALSYWIIDIMKIQKWSTIFAIVGMNPLFIYLFAESGGASWLSNIVKPFSMGLFSWMGEMQVNLLTSLIVWALMWYICHWLYKRKLFFKI
jgi:predicted acyltransferase